MSMVVYVVVKIRSQTDGFGLRVADFFYKKLWSIDVVALAASAHQGRCIVALQQSFVKRFAIKNCTAVSKEKAGSNHIQHVCADALVHT